MQTWQIQEAKARMSELVKHESRCLSYLIDTKVLSELRCKSPNPRVVEWFLERQPTTLYLSVLTQGEIRKEIEGVGWLPLR